MDERTQQGSWELQLVEQQDSWSKLLMALRGGALEVFTNNESVCSLHHVPLDMLSSSNSLLPCNNPEQQVLLSVLPEMMNGGTERVSVWPVPTIESWSWD